MAILGTTGTGLDRAIDLIANDYGLNMRISGSAIRGGAAAADTLNGMIVQAIKAQGLANDGAITTSDIYSINSFIRANALAKFTALHGNDENGVETAFHLVQGDGAITRLFGEAGVDTVLDGLYHIGFAIKDGRFLNEDGNGNASVEDVAHWLGTFLAPELKSGTLANDKADPQVHGTTGTGLDHLIERLADDQGLNRRLSQKQINDAARAGDGMAKIMVQAIKATGVADDKQLDAMDMVDINHWIIANRKADWAKLHGNDEGGPESGLHSVLGNGGRDYIFGDLSVDAVADGVFHIGFAISGDRFENEDGNASQRIAETSDWISLLLAKDLAAGTLSSNRTAVDPASLAPDVVFSRAAAAVGDGSKGGVDLGKLPATNVAEGTIAFDFVANRPDDGDTHVLFSKDGSGNTKGDITAFINDGKLHVLLQDGSRDYWIKAEGVTIDAGQKYSMAITFGEDGLGLFLNGKRVAAVSDATSGLGSNTRSLVIGAGTWNRDAGRPNQMDSQLDGKVSNFAIYDRILDAFALRAVNTSGALPAQWNGVAALAGDQPAVRAGTGLLGDVFDRGTSFNSIDDLIAQAATKAPQSKLTASTVNYGGFGEVSTLGQFLDGRAALTNGGGGTVMNTIGLHLQGYVWLDAGTHLVNVRSDDGFLLRLGGDELSSFANGRGFSGTSKTIEVTTSGLYAIDLYYFDNFGPEGLRLELNGDPVGADRFYASIRDYQDALAANGAMPADGLPAAYDGPKGTTGTGLDQLIQMIGEDAGLINNNAAMQIREGAAAADRMNHLIIDAIKATGAAKDGHISVADTYDLSDYIRANSYSAFLAAHGDDENGVETGFHLVQGNRGANFLFGEAAVDTVMDGLYHIGFETKGDRFANEDGNANARVETVTYWLNELLGTTPLPAPGPGTAPLLGSAARPDVVVTQGLNNRLAVAAKTLVLAGNAVNGTGNEAANTITGNGGDNMLDGSGGNDTLNGGRGNDTLIGGTGGDTLAGGGGDDAYWVDSSADVIREFGGPSSGTDTVHISGGKINAYTMGSHIERLEIHTTTGVKVIGNSLANTIVGHNGDDRLYGGDGADTLSGGGGNDQLYGGGGDDTLDGGSGRAVLTGGAGNDSYVVSSAKTTVAESAKGGIDAVTASVNIKLGANIEQLVLVGIAKQGLGNDLANGISGNDAANFLNGLGGNDVIGGNGGSDALRGGAGADTLTGGMGADTFVYASPVESTVDAAGRDTITDFSRNERDLIDLSRMDANGSEAGQGAFRLIAAFDGADGALMVTARGSQWLVQGDVNGDRLADFAILVTSSTALVAADFVL